MTGSPDREILTIEQAAELLGVSVKTFNKVLHSQRIPARKIGREWKFSRQALIDWVGNGTSDEFYRDSRDPRASTNSERGSHDRIPSTPPRGGERRTTGWHLKLD